jgi:hypothetical protein
MNRRDRVKLLFGPYQAPRLCKGDRATCLYCDCAVVITGWTSARISWPRCHARAIRQESATAVMHWGGVASRAVNNCRRAVGVGRTDNPGTPRLMLASAERGGEQVRKMTFTPEQREQHRQPHFLFHPLPG